MTSALDLHPVPGHPAAVLAAVHEALDQVGDLDEVAPGEFATVIAEADRARARLEALSLRLVAAAARARVPEDSGARNAGAWLASVTRAEQAAAARDVRLATDLEATLPATRGAMESGDVSSAHARVIADAVRRLPRTVSAEQRAMVEAQLVTDAKRVDPKVLRRKAQRVLAVVEPDPEVVDAHEDELLAAQEARARAKASLSWHDHGDGTTTGRFRVPTFAASVLQTVIGAMTSPRRGRLGASDAQAGDQRVDRDWAHERGLAFTQLLERLPTDGLHDKVAATVIVKVDLETLEGQVKAAHLDTGDALSAGEARRLACGAGILPAVLGGESLPLDLGRSSRFFTSTQRAAVALVRDTCAADGCDIPFAWCDLHHRQPWSTGGRTDLADLVPLCGFHHQRCHDAGLKHEFLPDGTVTFHRRM